VKGAKAKRCERKGGANDQAKEVERSERREAPRPKEAIREEEAKRSGDKEEAARDRKRERASEE
jgi:hypothetical protein